MDGARPHALSDAQLDRELEAALGVEPSEPDVMQRPPRDTREPLISGALARHIVMAVLVISGLTIAVFVAATELELPISSARTLALNVLVGMEISLLLSVRNLTGKEPRRPLSRMRPLLLACLTVVLLQLALTYLPVLQRIFDTTPVSHGTGKFQDEGLVTAMTLAERIGKRA